MRSARLAVILIGSPPMFADYLIGSPINSQSRGMTNQCQTGLGTLTRTRKSDLEPPDLRLSHELHGSNELRRALGPASYWVHLQLLLVLRPQPVQLRLPHVVDALGMQRAPLRAGQHQRELGSAPLQIVDDLQLHQSSDVLNLRGSQEIGTLNVDPAWCLCIKVVATIYNVGLNPKGLRVEA